MYPIFLTHSSVDGHLCCFFVLLLQIMLQWTLECMYFFKLEFSPDVHWGVGLLDPMATLIIRFLRNLIIILHSDCIKLPFFNLDLYFSNQNKIIRPTVLSVRGKHNNTKHQLSVKLHLSLKAVYVITTSLRPSWPCFLICNFTMTSALYD